MLTLTDQGVVIYSAYSSRPDLNLDEAWFEAWKVLAQMAPAVLLPGSSRANGADKTREEIEAGRLPKAVPIKDAIKRQTVWGPMYYDFGTSDPGGRVHYPERDDS